MTPISLQDAVGCSLSQHGSSKRGHQGVVLAIEGWGILSVHGRGWAHSVAMGTGWGPDACY